MKKSKPSVIGIFIISIIILSIPRISFTQCSLTCNGLVQVALDENCIAEIMPDDILEGNATGCGLLSVQIFDTSGNLIPTSPFIDGTYLDETLTVRLNEASTGNYCEGAIEVRDYIKPEIVCTNLSLLCTDSTHPDDVGYASVTDNCDSNVILSYVDSIENPLCDPSLVQVIYRTWTATDANGNNSFPCVQTITLARPLLDDIQFPSNKDDVEDLALDCADPDLSPENTGYPKLYGVDLISGASCEIWIMYTDSNPVQSCDASFTIIRTWTINDECSNQSIMDTQVLKVMDKTPPIITCPGDFTISANSTTCAADVFIPEAIATDDCTSIANISFSIKDENGILIIPNSIVNLPVGIHPIIYTATDDCGNTSECTLYITVDDEVNPTVTCESFTTVSLGNDGTVLVPANVFDDGSYDNCGSITFMARRMDNINCLGDDATVFNTSVPFYCCDVGDTIMIEMIVEDAINRLSNTCMVGVLVQDKLNPEIICPLDITLNCEEPILDLSITGEPLVSDNCAVVDLTFSDSIDLDLCNTGMVFRTWTVVDNQGQSNTCLQKITLIDTIPPEIIYPSSIDIAECGDSDDLEITGIPIVEDACGEFASGYDDTVLELNGGCMHKVIRIWTVYDWCMDTTYTGVQIIQEFDTSPPLFDMIPIDMTVECDAIPPALNINAIDDCNNGVVLTTTEEITPGICSYEYIIVRKWMAIDNCGNADSLSQQITVLDTSPPMIIGESPDTTISCDALIPNTVLTATDNCDTDVDLIMTEVQINGFCDDEYTLFRAWTAVDNCGNESKRFQTINVQDTIKPILLDIPSDITVECDMIPAPALIIATDNCDAEVEIDFNESIVSGVCIDEYILIRTWMAIDNCGNQSTGTQTIEVNDNTAPVLSETPIDMTVDCGNIPAAANITATDNCAGSLPVIFEETIVTGACAEDITVTRTWTATDNCGNTVSTQQVISSSDTEAPVLSETPMDMTVECGNIPAAANITATDNCAVSLPVIFEETIVTGSCAEDITVTRTWTSTDNCGNTVSTQQVISSSDTEAPVLSETPMDMTVECGNIPAAANITATDNCAVSLPVIFEETIVTGSCAEDITVTRTWTSTDNCGNTVSTQQVISSSDTEAPVLSEIPMDMTVDCGNIPAAANITATDNCAGNLPVIFEETIVTGSCAEDITVTRTWTSTDNCGNTVSTQQVISSSDTEAPVLSETPMDMTVECGNIPAAANITATDNCAGNLPVIFEETIVTGSCAEDITVTRTWTSTDNCGNTVSAQQVISSSDTEAPVLSETPTDMTVDCGNIPAAANITATDNCAVSLPVIFEETIVTGACAEDIMVTRTWTSTDNCGNTVSTQQVISSSDTEAPVLSETPMDMTVDCGNIPAAANITATDNCAGSLPVIFEETIVTGACAEDITVTRTWTATDNCGNTVSTQQVISSSDTEAPVLSETPMDMTVDCGNIPAAANITATDNCAVSLSVIFEETIVTGACAEDITVTRTWTATDNCGNTVSAQQVISSSDTEAPVLSELPEDLTVQCNAIPSPPMNITATDNCNVNLVFEESIREINCLDEYLLVWKWIATDNCGNETADSTTVMIIDDTAPILFGIPQNITVECSDIPMLPIITTTDNCDDMPEIFFDEFTTGTPCTDTHKTFRTWTAADNCGNQSIRTQIISLIDNTPPIIECPSDTVLNIVLAGTNSIVYALGPEVQDNCDSMSMISFQIDFGNNGSIDSLGLLVDSLLIIDFPIGVTTLSFEAEDVCGNMSACSTQVVVNGFGPPGFATISGQVYTEEMEYLEDIVVQLNGTFSDSTITIGDGYYEFINIPQGHNYSIAPYNNENPVNGLSTFDLILLLRHILEIEFLDSPYKVIAGDINRSGNLSTIDIVELRQLILGIIPTFQSNTSWRFVDASFVFPNNENPFQSSFPEYCTINNLDEEVENMDFISVKTGDLNYSAETNYQGGNEIRNLTTLYFETEDQDVAEGEKITIPIKAKDFDKILGFQYSLQFDPRQLEFIGLGKEKLPLFNYENFGLSFIEEGILTCSWFHIEGISIEPNTVLFELEFRAKESGQISSFIELNSAFTNAEIYLSDQKWNNLSLKFNPILQSNKAFKLYPSRPNPFKELSIIEFYLPKQSEIVFSVFNTSGKLLFQKINTYTEGYHEILMHRNQLEGGGLYYYQLKTDDGMSRQGKMILLE